MNAALEEVLVRLTPVETASGMAIGTHESEPPLPVCRDGLDPRRTLEDAIRPALQRPPALVMFSGGRDSSAVLAVAAALARREGLPLPIPITQTFPGFPRTVEDSWQHLVIRHLGLNDWERVTMGAANNLLGVEARSFIERHGLVAPAGVTQSAPVLRAAGNGVVLTGLEGDGLFNGGRFVLTRNMMARRGARSPRAVVGVAIAITPRGARERWHRHRNRLGTPWLRTDHADDVRRRLAREEGSEPLRWNSRVHWWARLRYVVALRQALDLLAGDFEADICHPLLDRRFLSSIAAWGGVWGRGTRTDLMRELFGDLLPSGVIERTSKADFTSAFWSGEARDFIDRWDGRGLPENLIDIDQLHRTWSENEPDARTGLLLQAAWLSTQTGRQVDQGFNCRLR